MAQTISQGLAQTVRDSPRIKEVHFLKDGSHVFYAFQSGEDKYARVATKQVADAGKPLGKTVAAPNADDKIVETMSREAVLKQYEDSLLNTKKK